MHSAIQDALNTINQAKVKSGQFFVLAVVHKPRDFFVQVCPNNCRLKIIQLYKIDRIILSLFSLARDGLVDAVFTPLGRRNQVSACANHSAAGRKTYPFFYV